MGSCRGYRVGSGEESEKKKIIMNKKKMSTIFVVALLFLMGVFILLVGCAPLSQNTSDNFFEKITPHRNASITENQRNYHQPSDLEKQSLGGLCTGENECYSFCEKNRGRCEKYCRGKPDSLCKIIFPPTNSPADRAAQKRDRDCSGTGTVTFTSPPMHLEDINFIEPIGLMIGGHVTPIDHGYYYANDFNPQEGRKDPAKFKDILAPADGIVRSVLSMPQEYQSSPIGDYRIIIDHTCTFYTIYIHVNQLSPKLQEIADTPKTVSVKAGELIGKAPGFDFSVNDDEVTLSGFVVPEHYWAEEWKIHTADMFAFFAEPIRTQLLEKNVRQKEPRGGKIDYDIDGKLVGNWFEENTKGYFGKTEYQRHSGYWVTHLSFAYDGLDPSLIIVSLGNFSNEPQQFAVKGNTPDPATVGIERSLVKYELVNFEYHTEKGERWDKQSFSKIANAFGGDQIFGTVLVQMLEDRKIKFEVFPGENAVKVAGFTERAKIYER